ncbi:hypothetical protein CDD83_6735 [Cordyceps sp. RAO-2017]|nr:hypothetical protein CDD83_6735 [Cordyceps sp. RAO-2017]
MASLRNLLLLGGSSVAFGAAVRHSRREEAPQVLKADVPFCNHTVAWEDSCWKIIQGTTVSYAELNEKNGGKLYTGNDSSKCYLEEHQVIQVPCSYAEKKRHRQPPALPGSERCKKTYDVQKGDVVHELARQHNVDRYNLIDWNELKNDTHPLIQIGQKLCVSIADFECAEKDLHTVVKGDDCYKIRSDPKVNITAEALERLNPNILNPGTCSIFPGQKLCLRHPKQEADKEDLKEADKKDQKRAGKKEAETDISIDLGVYGSANVNPTVEMVAAFYKMDLDRVGNGTMAAGFKFENFKLTVEEIEKRSRLMALVQAEKPRDSYTQALVKYEQKVIASYNGEFKVEGCNGSAGSCLITTSGPNKVKASASSDRGNSVVELAFDVVVGRSVRSVQAQGVSVSVDVETGVPPANDDTTC